MYLNVALAIRNCDFAEIMIPQNLLGIGMADLPTINEHGYISAPEKPGLGYDIDRDEIDKLTLNAADSIRGRNAVTLNRRRGGARTVRSRNARVSRCPVPGM